MHLKSVFRYVQKPFCRKNFFFLSFNVGTPPLLKTPPFFTIFKLGKYGNGSVLQRYQTINLSTFSLDLPTRCKGIAYTCLLSIASLVGGINLPLASLGAVLLLYPSGLCIRVTLVQVLLLEKGTFNSRTCTTVGLMCRLVPQI